MRYRKLRIAWSVVWGLAAVLLIVLWVRSYSTLYQIDTLPTVTSNQGHVYIGETFSATGRTLIATNLLWHSVRQIDGLLTINPRGTGLSIPDSCLMLIAGALAAVPWIPRRFSLRTMLIATTLVAVVLGLVVWAAR
jgi:hypothetical protein